KIATTNLLMMTCSTPTMACMQGSCPSSAIEAVVSGSHLPTGSLMLARRIKNRRASEPTRRHRGAQSMRRSLRIGSIAVGASILAACGQAEAPSPSPAPVLKAETAAAAIPYHPVATVLDLMRGLITLSAEVYWESVAVVVDAEGVHENAPQTDEEWIEVWA